ncbi:MAG: cell wall-binding repeat-containing protein [Rhodoglobus sp.]
MVSFPVPPVHGDEVAPEAMGEYRASDFVAAAQLLPGELIASLSDDLGLSGEEYLAQSSAAVQAVAVVDSLENTGVQVLGSSLDETTLTVNVLSAADVPLVEASGAIAVVGKPEPFVMPDVALSFAANPVSDFYGGQGYYFDSGASAFRCTNGFNGFATSNGEPQFISAGHCVAGVQNYVRALTMTYPDQPLSAATQGSILGTPVPGTVAFGGGRTGYDVGRISIGNNGVSPKPAVLNWGGGTGAPLSSSPVAVTTKSAAIVGSPICKSGSTTGWTCGEVLAVDEPVNVGGVSVNSIVTTMCTRFGDSGGAAVVNSAAVGITSWAADAVQCGHEDFVSGMFPMVSGGGSQSVDSVYGSSWELAVTVPTPVVTSPSATPITNLGYVTGTLAGSAGSQKISAYLDGAVTPFSTVSLSGGSWRIPLAGVAPGAHTLSIVGVSGWSRSTPITMPITVTGVSSRISGSDRFAVGVSIAQRSFPSPAEIDVVYVATGLNYPDALSATPAAAVQGGVLMLTLRDAIPADVRAEIVRLRPKKIVVVGGVNSVSSSVFDDLASIQPNIERLGGADRYEASRNIVRSVFQGMDSAHTAYIATGANFPDALSASSAGGAFGRPVILVNGALSELDSATKKLLQDLGVTKILIAGGPNSVSLGMQASLASVAPDTSRISGSDRFDASKNIAVNAFGSTQPTEVFLATGLNFPDALSGGVLAGRNKAPMIVVPKDCVSSDVLEVIRNFGASKVTLLGGPQSLTANVQNLKPC